MPIENQLSEIKNSLHEKSIAGLLKESNVEKEALQKLISIALIDLENEKEACSENVISEHVGHLLNLFQNLGPALPSKNIQKYLEEKSHEEQTVNKEAKLQEGLHFFIQTLLKKAETPLVFALPRNALISLLKLLNLVCGVGKAGKVVLEVRSGFFLLSEVQQFNAELRREPLQLSRYMTNKETWQTIVAIGGPVAQDEIIPNLYDFLRAIKILFPWHENELFELYFKIKEKMDLLKIDLNRKESGMDAEDNIQVFLLCNLIAALPQLLTEIRVSPEEFSSIIQACAMYYDLMAIKEKSFHENILHVTREFFQFLLSISPNTQVLKEFENYMYQIKEGRNISFCIKSLFTIINSWQESSEILHLSSKSLISLKSKILQIYPYFSLVEVNEILEKIASNSSGVSQEELNNLSLKLQECKTIFKDYLVSSDDFEKLNFEKERVQAVLNAGEKTLDFFRSKLGESSASIEFSSAKSPKKSDKRDYVVAYQKAIMDLILSSFHTNGLSLESSPRPLVVGAIPSFDITLSLDSIMSALILLRADILVNPFINHHRAGRNAIQRKFEPENTNTFEELNHSIDQAKHFLLALHALKEILEGSAIGILQHISDVLSGKTPYSPSVPGLNLKEIASTYFASDDTDNNTQSEEDILLKIKNLYVLEKTLENFSSNKDFFKTKKTDPNHVSNEKIYKWLNVREESKPNKIQIRSSRFSFEFYSKTKKTEKKGITQENTGSDKEDTLSINGGSIPLHKV